MKTSQLRLMETIEFLCKYKDLTDLVYKYVHQSFTKELIKEFVFLRRQMYYHKRDTHHEIPHLLAYSDKRFEQSCFGWRILGTHYKKHIPWVIHRISHKRLTYYDINANTPPKYY